MGTGLKMVFLKWERLQQIANTDGEGHRKHRSLWHGEEEVMILGGGLVRRKPSAREGSAFERRRDTWPTVTREGVTQLVCSQNGAEPQAACFAYSFIDSFNRCSSSIYSLPGTILARKETDTNHCLCSSHGREVTKEENYGVC